MLLIAEPAHLLCEEGEVVAFGTGFTTTVAVMAVPLHDPKDGVIVKVTVAGLVPLLMSVPLILPVPDAGIVPVIPALSLTQLNVAPGVVLDNTTGTTEAPLQSCWLAGVAVTAAVGLTTTAAVTVLLLQP